MKKYSDKYEAIADVRLRADVPGIEENQYWGAERLVKAFGSLVTVTM